MKNRQFFGPLRNLARNGILSRFVAISDRRLYCGTEMSRVDGFLKAILADECGDEATMGMDEDEEYDLDRQLGFYSDDDCLFVS